MRRAQRVRTAKDFAAVRAARQTVSGPALVLHWAANGRAFSRSGFVAGKQAGGAVVRNTVKRRLRAILHGRWARISPGFDLVLTARPAASQQSFAVLAASVEHLLQRAGLWLPAPTAPADPGEKTPS
jgi:ribonuclease P protein component